MERFPRFFLKKEIDELVGKLLINNVFSACSLAYSKTYKEKNEGDCLCYGYTGRNKTGKSVDSSTIFDLASLTKPLVTSLSIMVLVEEGKIELNDRVSKFFKRRLPGHKEINVYQLLSHSSGLPAHREYYKKLITFPEEQRKSRIIDWILAEKLCFTPGTASLYSDLGFILLGEIVERISGESLDLFWRNKISIPLKLENELFFTRNTKINPNTYITTGRCGWTNRELSGRVHDDNCRALGGVAGHAGLFGSAYGVLQLCEKLLNQYREGSDRVVTKKSTLYQFLKKENNSNWALGFDTPSGLKSSSGRYFSKKSVGHLGFTGTSFWIDLQEGVCIVLLTNRVLCGENLEPIRAARPIIHDTIMAKLTKK